ncbi:MAG: DUF354 domain-containing protein [Thaumarchaeota archaeon]|nr:DUF354 domain-containing protein [Nitrososphaerota archaeon]MDE1866495.1 DUF354 domain-containing protein [Nitrososphaerota archaeon]
MKIWFDILTPKQLLFFGPIVQKLGKNHKILCTSRNYREVVEIARIKHVNLLLVGKHGGSGRKDKLKASTQRIDRLFNIITKFSPDLVISFCSPEASRIAFGLGVKHIAFSDSPHAEAVMRLSLPFVQKLLIPWIIPKKEFEKYGISKSNIIQYKAIDASVIVKNGTNIKPVATSKHKKTIVIRLEESSAAYVFGKTSISKNIIYEFSKEEEKYNIIVLARYKPQIDQLKKEFGSKVKIMNKVVDGKSLLSAIDLFIGSGGTMTAEAALMGVPTISYDAVPNYIEKYLVKIGLVRRETNPKHVLQTVNEMLRNAPRNKEKARRILDSMEDPFVRLMSVIKTL